MSQFAAATQVRPSGELHFEVHRSALAEASADAALGAFWVLLWLVFVLALAPPAAALGGEPSAGAPAQASAPAVEAAPLPAWPVEVGPKAQPEPGPSSWGVAPPDRGGAG
jgi:hypothetical protein